LCSVRRVVPAALRASTRCAPVVQGDVEKVIPVAALELLRASLAGKLGWAAVRERQLVSHLASRYPGKVMM
jgi:hypothetical protein